MDKNVVVSYKTILLTFLTGVVFYIIIKLWAIIGIVFLALLISIALEHSVRFFKGKVVFQKEINRPTAVAITYVLVLFLMIGSIAIGIDPVVSQYDKLITVLSKYQNGVKFLEEVEFSISELISGFIRTTGGAITAASQVLTNLAAIMTVLILSVYISSDWENLKEGISRLFKEKDRKNVVDTIEEIENTVGLWLNGQLFLMAVIGFATYISLIILDVDFPLALGLMAGILEIVPVFGPLISAVITALVAPDKALLIGALFIVIQQLESNILVPKVMQKVSGFSPLVILIAILIGSNLFGLMGAIIAVPALMIAAIIVRKLL